jgi:hypothetical protein
MKPNQHRKIPCGLSDESAVALVEFLRKLTGECEALYAIQIRRHNAAQRNLYDPEQPWKYPHEPF